MNDLPDLRAPLWTAFVVQVGAEFMDFDNRGAMATGEPYLTGSNRRAARFDTFEQALDAVSGMRRRPRLVRIVEVELRPTYSVEVSF